MNIGRIIYSTLAITLGIFMFIYGGYDDSPGGQLLGLFMVIAGIASAIKMTRNGSKNSKETKFQ